MQEKVLDNKKNGMGMMVLFILLYAVAAVAAAVKHPDMRAGTVDFVALGVFAALDGDSVVPRGELRRKQRAVR